MGELSHLDLLKRGADTWNSWREQNPDVREPNLAGADLYEANLRGADLSDVDLTEAVLNGAILREANLRFANLYMADLKRADLTGATLWGATIGRADLSGADLSGADLSETTLEEAILTMCTLREADLSKADLFKADLGGANLIRANLHKAHLHKADLSGADLSGGLNLVEVPHPRGLSLYAGAPSAGANLSKADLREANLSGANLARADLTGADLSGTSLHETDLSGADLSGADLSRTALVRTNLEGASLTGCRVYGISAWDVRLQGAQQTDLVISPQGGAVIKADNLEVAQFLYLLLDNETIRGVIDTITSKVVLILGSFTPERKIVLDAVRDALRRHDRIPVLFDFAEPASRDLTLTVSTLAHMARYVIADITDPRSVPHELATVVPHLRTVPIQPLLLASEPEYGMFKDFRAYPWVLNTYLYNGADELLASLEDEVIAPAERKARELRKAKADPAPDG